MRNLIAWSFALLASSVGAEVIFEDSFDRRSSTRLGAPIDYPTEVWLERGRGASGVSIRANRMVLQGRGVTWAGQGNLVTTGYDDLVLTYRWAPLPGSDARDRLLVEWNPGTGFQTIASHALGGRTMRTTGVLLPEAAADLPDLGIRFRLLANAANEGVFIDNVVLDGERITPVPEPSAYVMLAVGIAVVLINRKRTPQSLSRSRMGGMS
jgi:hypothetical protein